MAAASCLLTEHQFMCSICLDVFTDPVTTSCGHNFCKNCITEHWNRHSVYQCPLCNKIFCPRPELQVNIFISEMAAQFRQSTKTETSSKSEEQVAKLDVNCDICTGTKLRALKSCLVCLASYCETHLEPHLTASALKKHQLIDPVKDMEDRICKKHSKALELFCQKDNICVCMLCTVLEHKTHTVIPLKEACEGKKVDLGKTDAEVQGMIQKRQLKIREIEHSLEMSDEDAEREKAAAVQIFNILSKFLEGKLTEIIEVVEEKQIMTQKQGKGFIAELEEEMSELMKRHAELEQLSHSEDDLHFLLTFLSLNDFLPNKDWTKVSILPPIYEGTVRKSLETDFRGRENTEGFSKETRMLSEAELRKVQKYAVDLTLSPDTAHSCLDLSDDGKTVWPTDKWKNLPNNSERFSYWGNVLANHGFSSGRFYYEVQVKGKNEWYVGVARQSVKRKSKSPMSPQNGYWKIWLKNNVYQVSDDPPVCLSLQSKPEKVGVFVDYEEGLVSFYDTNPAAHIYSFTGCSFTEKLYPFFNPCVYDRVKNSAPLIISHVSQIK